MSCSLYSTEKNNALFMPLSWITHVCDLLL